MNSQFDLDNKFQTSEDQKFSVIFVDRDGQESGTYTPVENPYAFDLREFVPASGYLDLEKLYELISQLIDWKQNQEGVAEENRVKVVKEWPDQPLANASDNEIITIKMMRREDAKMSKDGKKFQSHRGRHQRDFISSDSPAHVITILERLMDHELDIICWARDSHTADHRALWLERILIRYAWLFKEEGASMWVFKFRGPDSVMRQNEHTYHQRPLRFFARLSELEALYEPGIRHIDVQANLIDIP